MGKILVIDASSILAFNFYYTFDKNESSEVYNKLFGFILDKIKTNEIIILDKVFDEIQSNPYTADLKEAIKDYRTESLPLFSEVQRLIQENKREETIELLKLSEEAVNSELEKYENNYADLYLIAQCIKLKNEGKDPILITEENRTDDKKIIKKIPTICQKERIRYDKISQALFKIYKDELKFKLDIE
jgi:hypothetical protein